MDRGLIQDWDDMEAVWQYVFEELKVNPQEHPILLTEPPRGNIGQRMQTAKLFFEKFQVPRLFFHSSGVLSLYARGLTTGMVLDVGEGSTHCNAVFEGYSIDKARQTVNLGGIDIAQHLNLLLQREGYALRTTADFLQVQKMKESFCEADDTRKKKKKVD